MVSALRCAWIHSLLALVVLSLCVGVLAQGGTGEPSGLVTDPTGAVVAGATVTLTNPATKESRTTTTTAAGIYTFPAQRRRGSALARQSGEGEKGRSFKRCSPRL
jgi:hypothetical protein